MDNRAISPPTRAGKWYNSNMIKYSGKQSKKDREYVYNANTIYRLHYTTMLVGEHTTASDYRIVRPNGTDDTLFMLTLSGNGRIILNNRSFTLRPNSFAILSPKTPHDYGNAPGCKTWHFQWTHVRAPAVWKPFLDLADMEDGLTLIDLTELPRLEFRRVKALFNEMVIRAKAGSPLDRAFALNHLENAILRIYSALHGSSRADATFRERVGQYIRGNQAGNMSISSLAAVFGLSPSHFAHRFTSAFGVSPQVYVESCRLEYAKRLLEMKDVSIKTAAIDAGFTDPLYFSKCFHKAFGVTPSSVAKSFAGQDTKLNRSQKTRQRPSSNR